MSKISKKKYFVTVFICRKPKKIFFVINFQKNVLAKKIEFFFFYKKTHIPNQSNFKSQSHKLKSHTLHFNNHEIPCIIPSNVLLHVWQISKRAFHVPPARKRVTLKRFWWIVLNCDNSRDETGFLECSEW